MSALIELYTQNAVVFYSVVACIGLLVGSFLNVVIHRLPIMMERSWQQSLAEFQLQQKLEAQGIDLNDIDAVNAALAAENSPEPEAFNLNTPRSRCPQCGHAITWWQNVPVISYLMLRGKCYGCKTTISARYPIIECITMLLSLVVAWYFGPSPQALVGILFTWALISLTMIDFDHQLLPDSITLPLIWLGLLVNINGVFTDLQSSVIGAAAGYLTLWAVFHLFKLITGKEGMGYGDFKLLAAIGALLGWQALPIVILLSSLVGAVVGITLIVITGRDKNIPIPFGPYLAAAGWIAMIWGDTLSNAYFSVLT
jgi:leader peptidase (prepilin peptidase) / N-methyltransferase